MKTINNYILEKFKISKNIKNSAPLFKKGDKLLYVFIEDFEDEDTCEVITFLRFHLGYSFEKIENKTLYLLEDDNYEHSFEVFLNKNGYYEIEKNEALYGCNGVFIPFIDAKDFIKDFIKIDDIEKFVKNKLPEYMENIHKTDSISTSPIDSFKKILRKINANLK